MDHRGQSALWDDYHLRVSGCMVLSLLLLLGAVKLWPPQAPEDNRETVYRAESQELIALEEVVQTRQGTQLLRPPPPPVPVAVPPEVTLEELDLDFSENLLSVETSLPGPPGQGGGGATTGSSGAERPAIGPKTVRFVEPEYTRAARRSNIRAELVVEVLVGETGRVLEARIVERFLLEDDRDQRRPVEEIGYGLEEAALSAADRWMFRPARHEGENVQSYTTLTFTFGV